MPSQEQFVSKRAVDLSVGILMNAKIEFTYYLEYLLLQFPERRALPALEWLTRRGIKGKSFEEFVTVACQGSALEFAKQVFKGVARDSEAKPIYAGDLA